MTAKNKTKEIILGDDFGDVAVSANRVRVEIRTNGDVKVGIVANDDNEPTAGKEYEIGALVEGKGIYAGAWTPKDRNGKSLGKTFNLFAAPEDIGVLKTFNEAVAHVAGLKNWHGHNGFNHDVSGKTPDEALYDALRDGSYNGEWFIPTKDALNDNLYKNKYKFKSENAFATTSNGSGYAHWYWSCTEPARNSSLAWNQSFTDGDDDWIHKDLFELSVRCVRAELRP